MPKLLQINATANWGSTGRIAEQIGEAAMSRGWESYIAYGRAQNPSSSKLIEIGTMVGKAFHLLNSRLLDRDGLGSKVATERLIRQIDSIRPDVVHLHNIHGYYVNYEILFDYLSAKKIHVVWTFHDCWAFTGHCAHFMTTGCTKWKTGCFTCPLKREYPKSWGADRSQKNYDLKKRLFVELPNLTIVPVSKWMDEIVSESFLGNKKRTVIYNGIDIGKFNSQHERNKSTFSVLAVSNIWNADKGLNDLLELRSKLSSEFELYIVGLSKKQKGLLPPGICGIERTQNVGELVNLYSSADVLVNPTYADTFPTVNLEALACGTPVVTYKTGGSPEAIDENTGVVVEQGDIQGLADAIIGLKERPLSRDACRSRAEKYFDKDKCFEKYIDLYESLLSSEKY